MSKLKEILDKIATRLNEQDEKISKLNFTLGPVVDARAGSKVVSVNGNSVKLFSLAEVRTMFGDTSTDSNNYVFIINNGDGKAQAVHMESVTNLEGNYYAVFDRTVKGNTRINYIIFKLNKNTSKGWIN